MMANTRESRASTLGQRRSVLSTDLEYKPGCGAIGANDARIGVFAGKGRGIIYVQGEQKHTVTEAEMLDALYEESLAFAARVERGAATLSNSHVNIVPPDPLPRKDGSVPLRVVRTK